MFFFKRLKLQIIKYSQAASSLTDIIIYNFMVYLFSWRQSSRFLVTIAIPAQILFPNLPIGMENSGTKSKFDPRFNSIPHCMYF